MNKFKRLSLIQKICIGIILGAILGTMVPSWTWIKILGDIFIGSLKAIAPLLVFFLIIESLSKHKKGVKTHMKTVIVLYLGATLIAALMAVFASRLFPVELVLPNVSVTQEAPDDLWLILSDIILGAVMNPIQALIEGNYLSLLFWGAVLGACMRGAADSTKKVITDISDTISKVVQIIIQMAPIGITGLVFNSISEIGLKGMAEYGKLILLLVGTMLFVSYIVYPLMVFLLLKQNPYPLTMFCMKESGVPAFFTRSSVVNIPINMELSEKLGLDKESYSISIPLGATANSGGAAITISIMTLAAANTMGMHIPFVLAFLLCLLAAISSTGVSGIAGGSLLLIPLACSLFNISNDIAMQVVGIGFIIGVVQDSVETALNSAADLLFAATAEFYDKQKAGEKIDLNERVREAQKLV
ncbi:serine/threonine transporter SstT [Vagococcus zengguangii]|uniref:Serine/threonine transporter SstT n=1 Tax=Vagococcus zengguangii TaxID=2571750 RepID=A0A4D7CRC2_9ENTE|nr:serine/threonine transporter SstT [Vagococcus zengguangii]QCI86609.1 serine/threonine transporter SstT [Vagococcus zengguangii]TLG79755.1 serine/threonine transporter SstT [Vagococcus zengguangii]